MKAMIFAAGLGTRLRPITNTIPKALVEVGGAPMLERTIKQLHESAGIDSFVVNTHHFADKIEAFLKEKNNFGLNILLSHEEKEPLDTGGGIKKAAPLLGDGDFLVHNVDILTNIDYSRFLSRPRQDNLATLLVCEGLSSDRYLLFDDDLRLCGWTNIRTGEVKSPLPSFDPSKYHRLSFCGIHILSHKVLTLMREEPLWGEKFSIVDFYLHYAAAFRIAAVLAPRDALITDIGTPAALAEAERWVEGD